MIKDRDYHLIAERFAYALAYDRPIAEAIASDIDFCLGGEGRSSVIGLAHEPRIQVSYFGQPNGSGLFGLVECFLQLDNDTGELLATLIITNEDHAYYACLEDLTYVS